MQKSNTINLQTKSNEQIKRNRDHDAQKTLKTTLKIKRNRNHDAQKTSETTLKR